MTTKKILVNFSSQQCVHCDAHRGSNEYKALIQKGYVEVGTVRPIVLQGIPTVNIYWDGNYFNPADKYIANPNPSDNTDTTTA